MPADQEEDTRRSFAATCGAGLEPALAAELVALGLDDVVPGARAVTFVGPLRAGYRACLWSRVATRVLLFVRSVFAGSTRALYAELRRIPWAEHLGRDGRLAVTFVGTNDAIVNTRFGAQKTKDAVVDALRDDRGRRPSVDLDAPDVRIHVALQGTRARVSIDLSGTPLHRRGLDRDGGPAPMKESLAAGLLWLSGAAAEPEVPVVDPMCGSATLLVEAAGMKTRAAPGLTRRRWGFSGWRGHDARAWQRLCEEARDVMRPLPPDTVFGGDIDAAQHRRAREHLRRAGFERVVSLSRIPLADWSAPVGVPPGRVVTNPPYGARLDAAGVTSLWRELGNVLRCRFPGWDAWILAGRPALARQLGLRPRRRIPLFNGPLEGRLLHVPISDRPPARFLGRGDP
ncbi:MAG: THUMP domain-containing protein [Myxococcota bacterium]